ncbi:hypothetical protein [Halodesulfurarchaeum sp.]|uniref:hypothetical protein n=1 Tax=Halodesulfurarchaeum sp. TaxID=1980530 RepID=UPI001BBF59A1|nr:hypothetical protein [Halodesulfurarchaeum sp.]
MSDVPEAVDYVDNSFFRRGMVVAILYAIVDGLILLVPGPFVLFRLIGVIAAYYATRDMIVLREAGLEWGKTRFAILVFVGIGGFLGFFFYAWRRTVHLRNLEIDPDAIE